MSKLAQALRAILSVRQNEYQKTYLSKGVHSKDRLCCREESSCHKGPIFAKYKLMQMNKKSSFINCLEQILLLLPTLTSHVDTAPSQTVKSERIHVQLKLGPILLAGFN